jgi:hypothetical protein
MRYWWVNQNQTSRHEIEGGYLWSPKRNANHARNPFYESMREVAPGDLVFSFVDTRIAAIGIAESYCYESPKPEEFGRRGTELGGDWMAAPGAVRAASESHQAEGAHGVVAALAARTLRTPASEWERHQVCLPPTTSKCLRKL